jgi:hypothetical protein
MREHAEPSVVEIYAGSLDNPDALAIEDHVWTSEQTSWLKLDDRLPHYPRGKPQVASGSRASANHRRLTRPSGQEDDGVGDHEYPVFQHPTVR